MYYSYVEFPSYGSQFPSRLAKNCRHLLNGASPWSSSKSLVWSLIQEAKLQVSVQLLSLFCFFFNFYPFSWVFGIVLFWVNSEMLGWRVIFIPRFNLFFRTPVGVLGFCRTSPSHKGRLNVRLLWCSCRASNKLCKYQAQIKVAMTREPIGLAKPLSSLFLLTWIFILGFCFLSRSGTRGYRRVLRFWRLGERFRSRADQYTAWEA